MNKVMSRITAAVCALFFLFSVVGNAVASGFLDLLNPSCVAPTLGVCINPGPPPHPSVKVSLWFPVGVIEVSPKACDFGNIGLLSDINPLTAVCNTIPFVQGEGGVDDTARNYRRQHVHVYVIPKFLQMIIYNFLMGPLSLPCSVISALNPMSLGMSGVTSVIQTFQNVTQYLNIFNKLMSITAQSPVMISEIVSPIWLTEANPDTVTVAPAIATAMINAMMAQAGAASVLVCPGILQYLNVGSLLPSNPLYDPNMVCIGFWGNGYPRNGLTMHGDYKIANAIAAVRFWHLFTKTFPVISEPFSYDDKLQLAYPAISPCFTPGDSVLPQFAITYLPDRKTIMIIWKKFTKCC